ncbi:MAG TPA: histidinol-phosphatase [Bacteroidetes bacterium]|nr:histidinol-phosphatase [Bacteroidota bacterium]
MHGEEFGKKQGSEPYTWVLDPIDGTRSFIAGTMTWATLIALEFEDKPVIGVMHQPYVGETFYGTPEGAWLLRGAEKRRLKVNPAPDLAHAFGTTTAPHYYNTPEKAKFLNNMRAALRNIRYDADAYFFALLAAGHIDIALDADLQAYDIAPLIPIIEGAGGIVSTWDRKSARLGGDIIAAASRELYEEALALL